MLFKADMPRSLWGFPERNLTDCTEYSVRILTDWTVNTYSGICAVFDETCWFGTS